MDVPVRKQNRLDGFDYSSPNYYFVAICTEGRRNILSEIAVGADIIRPETKVILKPYGKIVEEAIENIPKFYPSVRIDKYIIMPNHIHILLVLQEPDGRMISAPTLSVIIGQMKRWCSKQTGRPIWQKSFYDHIVRSREDYEGIWTYIENNPKQWELDEFYTI